MPRQNNIPELDKLFQDVREYRSSKNYMELLDFIKRFRNIAPYNAMLIHIQKPGSKYIASAKDWYARFGRRPKPGARPLIILWTFGPVSFVYELEDTEGEEFPIAITLNSNHDRLTQLATIYHELGHVYCGHLGNQELDYLPKRCVLPIEVKEFEAESVCWLLCEREGIKNPSAEYLSNYLNSYNEIPGISIDTVLKAAAKIEQMRNKVLTSPRKELKID